MRSCILTIIKDEHRYLEEWIRYHCELGIDTLFIIEDNGSESHKSITDRYQNVILRQRSEFKGDKQHECFEDAYHTVIKQNYDWCFIMDVDEFITTDIPLDDIFDKYADEPYIWLQWHNYGANGILNKTIYNKPIFDIYTKRCGNRPIDIAFHKTGKMCYNCHKYNDVIFMHWLANTPAQDDIYLRHYITKSWTEWKWKLLERGMCNPGNRKLEDFFIYNPDMIQYKDILCKYL